MKKIKLLSFVLFLLLSSCSNFEVKTYTIVWKDYDGTILEIDEDVKYGSTPSYDSETPNRMNDAQYSYSFIGWSPTVVEVVEDTTYVAQYYSTVNHYTVTWNVDGDITTEDYAYGDTPTFKGGTPTKPNSDDHSYKFNCWSPAISSVAGNIEYTAIFSEGPREYLVNFNANGGSGCPAQQIKFRGSASYIPDGVPTRTGYIFYGWNCYESELVFRAGDSFDFDFDVTFYAMWWKECEICHGTHEHDKVICCDKCNGTGKIAGQVDCTVCNGSGKKVCSECKGLGAIVELQCYSCGRDFDTSNMIILGTGLGAVIKCPYCRGDCKITSSYQCFDCSGSGKVSCDKCTGTGKVTGQVDCSLCSGSGERTIIVDCEYCQGGEGVRPNAPILSSKEYNKVILQSVSGYEYSMDGISWQKSNEFNGLHSLTDYCFYQRKSNDSVSPFGITSFPLELSTPQAPTYSITYVLNGGINSQYNPSSYTIEESFEFSDPFKQGYTFLGWFDTADNQIIGIKEGSTGNITIIAKWNAGNKYNVVLDPNGGNVEQNSFLFQFDQPYSLPVPNKRGYSFLGWYNGSSKVENSGNWSIDNDVSLIAHWSIINYNIKYDLNGGINNSSNPSSYNVTTGEFALLAPTKNGYTFLGWTGSNGSDPELKVVVDCNSIGDLSYKANWSLDSYSITYVLYGGTNSIENPSTYTTEDIIVLKDASKDCYSFEGWFKDPEFINKVETLVGQFGDLILYAKFVPFSFTATFDAGDGKVEHKLSLIFWEGCDHNVEIVLKQGETFDIYSIEIPVREGFYFAGWKNSKTNHIVDSLFTVDSDLILKAEWKSTIYDNNEYVNLESGLIFNRCISRGISLGKWTPYVYFAVPYYLSGECDVRVMTEVSNGGNKNYANAYIKDITTGETVLSRSKGANNIIVHLNLIPGHLYVMCGDVSYGSQQGNQQYAWVVLEIKNVYSSTLNAQIGNETSVNFDEEIPLTSASREGYDFVGWYDEQNEPITEKWNYSTDKTFYAEWTIHNYTITYILNGGTNNSSNPTTYNLNDEVILNSPIREGYDFVGWFDENGNPIDTSSWNYLEDITIYAHWVLAQ